MKIYHKLREYLERKITTISNEINAYNNKISALDPLKNALEQLNLEKPNISIVDNLIANLNIKEKDQMLELIKQVKIIEKTLTELYNDINNIEEATLTSILDFFEIEPQQKYIYDLKTIKNTSKYINNPKFKNQNLIEDILKLKQDLKKVLLNCITEAIEKLKEQTKKLITTSFYTLGREHYKFKEQSNFINELVSYKEKFNFDGPVEAFDSLDQMQKFFNLIENSTLEKEEILELVLEFCKFNVDFHNKRLSFKDTVLRTNIEQNAKEVVGQIESLAKDKNNNTEEVVSNVTDHETYEINLTEEEQKIYEAIKEIVKIHSNEIIEFDFVECYSDDFRLENRKSCYGNEDDLNWDIIITDITQILEPNLKNNKENIFEIFKYILYINEKEIEIKNQKQQLTDGLIELDKKIDEVLRNNSHILKKYNNLDASRKNYYDSLYKMVLEGESKEDLTYAKSNIEAINETIESIKLLAIIPKLFNLSLQLKEYLSNNIISKDIFEEFDSEAKKLILEYESITNNEENLVEVKTIDIPQYSDKNLIYFMPDDLKEYSEEYKKELEESVTKLLVEPWKEALIKNRNHFLSEVFYIGQNGKIGDYDKEPFEVYRAKGKRLTRTGFITINICEENYQKIKQRYNIDISHTFIAIVGVISTPRSNHDEYELINIYIRKNRERIMYLVNLFGNKNSNEEELFYIVDESLKFSNQIKTGNILGGVKK